MYRFHFVRQVKEELQHFTAMVRFRYVEGRETDIVTNLRTTGRRPLSARIWGLQFQDQFRHGAAVRTCASLGASPRAVPAG